MTELVSTLIRDRDSDDYMAVTAIAVAVVVALSSLVALVPGDLAARSGDVSSSVTALL